MALEESFIQYIKQTDPQFNEHMFKIWCQDLLIILQDAWVQRNIEVLQKYETVDLYQLHCQQLETLQAQGIDNVVKDMEIENISITDFDVYDNHEVITVKIDINIIDYYEMGKEYKKVLRGDKNKKARAKYTMEICRPNGFLTNQLLKDDIEVCPSCGAPIDINTQKYCDYCHTLIVTMSNCYKVKNITVEKEIVESSKAKT